MYLSHISWQTNSKARSRAKHARETGPRPRKELYLTSNESAIKKYKEIHDDAIEQGPDADPYSLPKLFYFLFFILLYAGFVPVSTKRFTSLSPVSRWLPIDVHEDEFYLTDIGFCRRF